MIVAILAFLAAPASSAGSGAVTTRLQSNAADAASFHDYDVKNVSATTQHKSCYTPEVPFFTSDGTNDGYAGTTACATATTGDALGPYATQARSNAGHRRDSDAGEGSLRIGHPRRSDEP